MTKESTNKMNEVIVQLKLKGFKQVKDGQTIQYCKGTLCAWLNFRLEYICFGRTDLDCPNSKEGLDVINFTVHQLLKRMFIT